VIGLFAEYQGISNNSFVLGYAGGHIRRFNV